MLMLGLNLSGSSQQGSASGADAAEGMQPQSPQQRPPHYLSAMLTYMAQVCRPLGTNSGSHSALQAFLADLVQRPLLPLTCQSAGCWLP